MKAHRFGLCVAELAAALGQVYVVGATHPALAETARVQPEKFTIAKRGGILATDEMLAAVSDELGTFKLG